MEVCSPQMVELWRYLLLLELEENLKDDDGGGTTCSNFGKLEVVA
jgi:hypothetical protein